MISRVMAPTLSTAILRAAVAQMSITGNHGLCSVYCRMGLTRMKGQSTTISCGLLASVSRVYAVIAGNTSVSGHGRMPYVSRMAKANTGSQLDPLELL